MARVVHFDISAEDPEELRKFYENVFGWKFEKWEGPMEYWMIRTGEGPGINGGMARRDGQNMDINTIEVPDLDEFVQKVQDNGATLIAPKVAIPGIGWFAIFKDVEGNMFGMMQEDKEAK